MLIKPCIFSPLAICGLSCIAICGYTDIDSPLSGNVARQFADAYASSVRLQSVASTGPLEWMDDIELEHWMRRVAMRCELTAANAIQQALLSHKSGRDRQVQKDFQV